jgi:hypothetical protein
MNNKDKTLSMTFINALNAIKPWITNKDKIKGIRMKPWVQPSNISDDKFCRKTYLNQFQ